MAVQQPDRTRQLEINARIPQPKARCTYHGYSAVFYISTERAFGFVSVRSRSVSQKRSEGSVWCEAVICNDIFMQFTTPCFFSPFPFFPSGREYVKCKHV